MKKAQGLEPSTSRGMAVVPLYTVFHVTHWKAGSQWVRGVLQRLAPDRIVVSKPAMANIVSSEIVRQGVHTPVYLPKYLFDERVPAAEDHRFFVVIRDLRDAAVSWYFSIKHSHQPINLKAADDLMEGYRRRFNELSVENGLCLVIEERLSAFANIQQTWLRQPEHSRLMVRYEDLIADEHGQFNRIFDYAGLEPDPEKRRAAIEAESFHKRTGRKPGEEQIDAHHRKGVAGDWQNHFTDRVKDAFKEKFGQVLIDTGYEADLSW